MHLAVLAGWGQEQPQVARKWGQGEAGLGCGWWEVSGGGPSTRVLAESPFLTPSLPAIRAKVQTEGTWSLASSDPSPDPAPLGCVSLILWLQFLEPRSEFLVGSCGWTPSAGRCPFLWLYLPPCPSRAPLSLTEAFLATQGTYSVPLTLALELGECDLKSLHLHATVRP